jgi:tetrahydromethanopterin S-methyltransferase subunit A
MINIIDQYGTIDAQIKELEAIKAKLKAELVSRGKGYYSGKDFQVEVQEYPREQINANLVRKLADETFVQSVTVTQQVKAVVVNRLDV